MGMLSALGLAALCATASAATPGQLGTMAVSRLQELNLEQLEALYSLLDDDGSGSLTVHEMIDLFDGINNDALLIDDCNGNPAPHHWLGDGYCDDGTDVEDGGLDFNCNIFLCDDSDCGEDCRVVEGRDQVEVAADMGVVYGNVRDANGEDFEIDLEEGTTYYIWTNIGTSDGHISDTTMTLFDADGTTVLAQNDDGPVGAVNSYIEYTPTAAISAATLLVAPKTRQDRGTFQLQVSLTEPDLTIRPPPPAGPVTPVTIAEGRLSQDNMAYTMLTWDFASGSDSPMLMDGDTSTIIGGDANAQHDEIVAVRLSGTCDTSSFRVYGRDRDEPDTDLRHIRVAYSTDGSSWTCYTQSDDATQGGTPGMSDASTMCNEGPSHAASGNEFNVDAPASYVEFADRKSVV